MSGNPGLHSWGDTKALVDAAKVIVHIVKGDRGNVVFNLFRERIGQASEAANAHPHGEVLTLDIAGADVFRIGLSGDAFALASYALSRAVALLSFAGFAVLFDEHREIYLAAERPINRIQVGPKSIASQLNAIGESGCQIKHEFAGRSRVAVSDHPRADELCVGVHRDPGPYVASVTLCGQRGRDVLLLSSHERPDFITLNPFARKIHKRLVHIVRTGRSKLYQQLHDCIFGNPGHANRRTNRIALYQCANNLYLLGFI